MSRWRRSTRAGLVDSIAAAALLVCFLGPSNGFEQLTRVGGERRPLQLVRDLPIPNPAFGKHARIRPRGLGRADVADDAIGRPLQGRSLQSGTSSGSTVVRCTDVQPVGGISWEADKSNLTGTNLEVPSLALRQTKAPGKGAAITLAGVTHVDLGRGGVLLGVPAPGAPRAELVVDAPSGSAGFGQFTKVSLTVTATKPGKGLRRRRLRRRLAAGGCSKTHITMVFSTYADFANCTEYAAAVRKAHGDKAGDKATADCRPTSAGLVSIWLGSTQRARLAFKTEYTFVKIHVPKGGATANRLTMRVVDPACGGAAIVQSVVTMSKGLPVPSAPR